MSMTLYRSHELSGELMRGLDKVYKLSVLNKIFLFVQPYFCILQKNLGAAPPVF